MRRYSDIDNFVCMYNTKQIKICCLQKQKSSKILNLHLDVKSASSGNNSI